MKFDNIESEYLKDGMIKTIKDYSFFRVIFEHLLDKCDNEQEFIIICGKYLSGLCGTTDSLLTHFLISECIMYDLDFNEADFFDENELLKIMKHARNIYAKS